MEVVKKSGDYKIFKKRSGRYGVKSKDGKWVNGAQKAEILNKEGLIKVSVKKAAPVEEPPAAEPEASTEATAEAPAEESKTEES